MSKPLDGIRVADFSHVFAGPIASWCLGSLGADVIKVEAPGAGDRMRNYGPDVRYHGMAPNFIAANAGKRSLAVDLKRPEGREIARRLISSSDIVIENLRPGTMRKFGLGYDEASALRPGIIYCAISGYGQTGPRRDYPAIDNIVQATSGMMGLLAGPDSDGEVIPFPIVDTYTATLAATAILAAIIQRGRDGRSQFIDVAMMDSSITLMSSVIVPYLISGILRGRKSSGKRGYSDSPASGTYLASDGRSVSLGVVQDNQFSLFCDLIGRTDLAQDPRYRSTVERLVNADTLVTELAAVMKTRPAEEWETLLAGRGVPCGVVRDMASATGHPDLLRRGVLRQLTVKGLPQCEEVAVVNLGFSFEHDGPEPSRPPPWLGEHTGEVLELLGYGPEERSRFLTAGIVAQGGPGRPQA